MMFARIVHLKFDVRLEIGERRINHCPNHDEVDRDIRRLLHSERHRKIRERQIFVSHPSRDFDNLGVICLHIPRMLDHRPQAFDDGTARLPRPRNSLSGSFLFCIEGEGRRPGSHRHCPGGNSLQQRTARDIHGFP